MSKSYLTSYYILSMFLSLLTHLSYLGKSFKHNLLILVGMISYLPAILLFWYCALASKTYKCLPIYLSRYLHNKFFAPLPGIVLHCVFKVFPFTLVICVYVHLKKKKKKLFCSLFYGIIAPLVPVVCHNYFSLPMV